MTPEQLEERIRRAMATRTMSPPVLSAPRAFPWRWIVTATAAVLALLLTPLVYDREAPTGPVARPAAAPAEDNPFVPTALMAQTSARPAFPLVAAPGRDLRPGQWKYGRAGITGKVVDEFRYELRRSTYAGTVAWLMVTSFAVPDSGWRVTDSLYATIDRFMPLFRVWPAGSGLRIEQTFREHEVMVGTSRNGYTSWQVKALRDSTDDTRNGGSMRLPDLTLQFRSLALESQWRGSVAIPTENEQRIASIYLNLAVDGEEEVETPAGRFLCWRVRTANPNRTMPTYRPGNPDPGLYFWISKDERLLVQTAFVNQGKSWSRLVLTEAHED